MEKNFTLAFPDEKTLLRGIIEMLKPFLKGIRDREADVFAWLLLANYKRKHILDKKDRFELILNTNSRKELYKDLEMNGPTLRNALVGLRKAKLLKEDNTINDFWLFDIDETKKITISFDFILKN